ncbi:MAG: T9SS type A sorting domain-containing protein, partial [Bacteroidota bacterium]
GGGVYKTVSLSGTVQNQQGGYGTVWVPVSGVQNGGSDGIALVSPSGDVVEFVSYEGTVTASSGPASGQTSEDIGVAETSSTPVGHSLQLAGTGTAFTWMAPGTATPGQPNTGQTLGDGSVPVVAWINELHYDNASSDVNEGVEIAGTAGGDLTGWSVVFYNGSNGTSYATLPLSGTIDAESAGLGALWFTKSSIQNGAPDGLALVNDDDEVVQFLSYEGTMTAANGPAAGMTSDNIGVSETSSTSSSYSLQLEGTGSVYADFAWVSPQAHSRGDLNAGQTMSAASREQSVASDSAPEAAFDLTIYPNPVRDHATVALALANAGDVQVEVYDTLGRQLSRSTTALNAGFQSVPLDARALPAGAYIVRVTAGNDTRVERLTVVR